MFNSAKFVVIDNDEMHLKAVASAIGQLGAGCRTIHYTAEEGAGEVPLGGVRIVFTDLHLAQTGATTTDNMHYATIAGILEELISIECGPYVVCLWTRHPDELNAFSDYLNTRMGEETNRPLKIFSLDKTEFIDINTGDFIEGAGLSAVISEHLSDVPQLTALMSLESDVVQATDITLATIRRHAASINANDLHAGLDLLLNHLGDAAVGNLNIHTDVRRAINSAVFPLIADEAMNCAQTIAKQEAWRNSVTIRDSLPPLELQRAAELTFSIHAALDHDPCAGSWGMVSNPPSNHLKDEEFSTMFGITACDFLANEVKFKAEHQHASKIVYVRTGASCDIAQQKRGPVQCVLGVEVQKGEISNKNWATKIPWKTPSMAKVGEGVFQVWFFPSFSFTTTDSNVDMWTPKYRLRNEMLMELITKVAAHHARPGITRFRER